MALEDVAKLISPKKPEDTLKILNAFYGKKELTIKQILEETGMDERIFRYYLTRFRKLKLIRGERTVHGYRYLISPHAFHAYLDGVLFQPVKNL